MGRGQQTDMRTLRLLERIVLRADALKIGKGLEGIEVFGGKQSVSLLKHKPKVGVTQALSLKGTFHKE